MLSGIPVNTDAVVVALAASWSWSPEVEDIDILRVGLEKMFLVMLAMSMTYIMCVYDR